MALTCGVAGPTCRRGRERGGREREVRRTLRERGSELGRPRKGGLGPKMAQGKGEDFNLFSFYLN